MWRKPYKTGFKLFQFERIKIRNHDSIHMRWLCNRFKIFYHIKKFEFMFMRANTHVHTMFYFLYPAHLARQTFHQFILQRIFFGLLIQLLQVRTVKRA